jgi:hypothetical protein
MAIYYPDILENNNPSYPLLDATFLKGTAYPLASISTTGSIPADKRNVGMIVFDSGSGKFYGYKGSSVSNWATASNWIEFGSGSGAGSTGNHLFDRCIVDGFTYDGYNAGGIGLQFISVGSTLNALVGDNLGYKVGDKIIVYIDDKNYVKGTVNQVPGGFGTGSINILVETVIGTANSDNYCITLDLTADSYVYATQTGSFLYSGSYDSVTSALTLYSRTQNYSLDLSGLAGGGGGFPITASNQGNTLTENARSFNFTGNAVTATNIGSAVTVTINTGSATAVDITALNNFTGSAQTSITGLNSFSGSAQTSITALNIFSGSAQTSLTALNTFSGSANTRLGNLEAITGSYVTNAKTGSFYYSSSINSNVITFNQGDGTTESVTIVTVPTASYATNIYNSNGTLTGAREVSLGSNSLKFNNTSAFFTVSGSDRITFNNLNEVNTGYVVGYDLSGAFTGTQGIIGYVTASKLTVASASYAPNLYNSNGTLTGDRVVTLGANNQFRITPGAGESEFRISDGVIGGPFSYEVAVSGSGEFRINSSVGAIFQTNVYVSPLHVLTLAPRHPLPAGVPTGSFAVSSSNPPRPFMWDGTSWYAL